jgi:hypothetical protein
MPHDFWASLLSRYANGSSKESSPLRELAVIVGYRYGKCAALRELLKSLDASQQNVVVLSRRH